VGKKPAKFATARIVRLADKPKPVVSEVESMAPKRGRKSDLSFEPVERFAGFVHRLAFYAMI
jgi:hypothetical protein